MGKTPPVQHMECLETDAPTTQRLGFGGDESHSTFRLFLSDSFEANCNEVRRKSSRLNVVAAHYPILPMVCPMARKFRESRDVVISLLEFILSSSQLGAVFMFNIRVWTAVSRKAL